MGVGTVNAGNAVSGVSDAVGVGGCDGPEGLEGRDGRKGWEGWEGGRVGMAARKSGCYLTTERELLNRASYLQYLRLGIYFFFGSQR